MKWQPSPLAEQEKATSNLSMQSSFFASSRSLPKSERNIAAIEFIEGGQEMSDLRQRNGVGYCIIAWHV